jgi:hypothetical protein
MVPELRLLIDRSHIREGRLYGHLPLDQLTEEAQRTLEQSGWRVHAYRDRPVASPPEATIRWDVYRARFQDNMRHAAAHRLPGGIPLAGPKDAILDELIASVWDQRVEELRTVLSAFAFASLWPGEAAPHPVWNRDDGWDDDAWPAAPGGLRSHGAAGDAASPAWPESPDSPGSPDSMEGAETFYFYTQAMRDAALQALQETAAAPAADDPVWALVDALR